MAYPPVVVVDDKDKVVGAAMLKEVWEKGLYHRIVRVLVEDENGRVLLQKRSKEMNLYPECWACSASGHVDDGDSYEQAARNEMTEEIGLDADLEEIDYYKSNFDYQGRKMNRFNKIYLTKVHSDQKFNSEEHEVSEVRWFTKEEVRRLVQEHPDQVTDGLQDVVRRNLV